VRVRRSGLRERTRGTPRTGVLGYSQPSLAGLFDRVGPDPGLRPGLLSAVPSGLVLTGAELTRTGVLGYSQPSPSTSSGQALRDLVPIQRDS